MYSRPNLPHKILCLMLALLSQFSFCALRCAGQAASESAVQLRNLFASAQTAQNRQDFRAAATYYEEILRLRPDIAPAWANLGLMHQSLGDYQRANHDFEVALHENPELYVPNLFLGIDFLHLQQPQHALPFLKRAVRLNPRDEQATISLGQAYESLHHYPEANEWFYRTTVTHPKSAEAWYGLGVTYLSLQDSAITRLRQLNQNSVYARALLADAFLEQERTNDAIKIYKKLLESQTQPPCLQAALGFAYAQGGSFSLAQAAFQEELSGSPGCLAARLGLARVAIARNDPAGALRELNAAWEADPKFFSANLKRLWNRLNVEQLNRLEDWLKQHPMPRSQDSFAQFLANSIELWRTNPIAVFIPSQHPANKRAATNSGFEESHEREQTNPEYLWAQGHYTACESELEQGKVHLSPSGLLLLAQCSYYSGDYRASLSASDSVLKNNSRSLPALYWNAKSAQELATEALVRTTLLGPHSFRIHLLLAELYRQRQEFSASEAEYAKALDLKPNDPAAHLGLADVYYQEVQFQKALAQLRPVLQADPENPEAGFLMGGILVRYHRFAEAMPYLKTALKGAPLSMPQVRSLLSRCYAAQGQIAEAISELRPALAADTEGIFHYQLYQLYERAGDHEAGVAALKQSQMLRQRAEEQRQKVIEGGASNP